MTERRMSPSNGELTTSALCNIAVPIDRSFIIYICSAPFKHAIFFYMHQRGVSEPWESFFCDGCLQCAIITAFGILHILLVLHWKLVYVPSNPASWKAFLYLLLSDRNCLTSTLTLDLGIAWRLEAESFFPAFCRSIIIPFTDCYLLALIPIVLYTIDLSEASTYIL